MNGLLTMANETKRTGDLFSTKNIFARASKLVGGLKVRCRWVDVLKDPKLITRRPQGVDNVYTQHQPLLVSTVDNINKGCV